MPSYPHIDRYYEEKQRFIDYGGSDNEQNIRRAFLDYELREIEEFRLNVTAAHRRVNR